MKIKNPSPSDDAMNIINKYKKTISAGHYAVLREHIGMFKQIEEEFKQTVDMLRKATETFAAEQTEYSDWPKTYMVIGKNRQPIMMSRMYTGGDDDILIHDYDEARKLYAHEEDKAYNIVELKQVDIPKMSLWSKVKLILNI